MGITASPLDTDHFDGHRFRNPNGANGQPVWMVPRMLLTPRSRWPASGPVAPRPPVDAWRPWVPSAPRRPVDAGPDDVVVTFIGHATFLIQVGATSLLIDP